MNLDISESDLPQLDIENNSVYLYIIISAIFTLILYIIYRFISISSNKYSNQNIIVKQSLIPNSGRGVFANKDFKKGEIVEVCPLISDKRSNINNSIIKDYTFKNKFKDEEVIVFGLCSLYNHSDNNNIYHDQDGNDNMVYTAVRDINKGEELYVNYGVNYWKSRNK